MFLEKPPYGGPCNSCGLCCVVQQCPLSVLVFGSRDLCPALGEIPNKKGLFCGLASRPDVFFDIKDTDKLSPDIASRAAGLLIGAGIGCDAREVTEEVSPETSRRIAEYLDKSSKETAGAAFKVVAFLIQKLRPEFR